MVSFLIMALGTLMGAEMVQPETPKLIETSDLITYVEIIRVTPEIGEQALESLPPGMYRTFPSQKAQVRLLRFLKGEVRPELDEVVVIKKENGFFLSRGKRRVLYLKRKDDFYEALGNLGGEHRLPSAMWELHRREGKGYGVVLGVLGEPFELVAVALRGRHSAPLQPESERWMRSIVKTVSIDELRVAEIQLEPGSYTILLQKGKEVYHPYRLVDGFYPYVILDEESPWKIVYINAGWHR